MRTMTARELKNRTGEALRAARAGDRVTITVHGKPVAIVSPAGPVASGSYPLRPFEVAWKEIEEALSRSEPAFASWREAEAHSRGRR